MQDSFEARGIRVLGCEAVPGDRSNQRRRFLLASTDGWTPRAANVLRACLLGELGGIAISSFSIAVETDGVESRALHRYSALGNLVEDMTLVGRNLRGVAVRCEREPPRGGLVTTHEFSLRGVNGPLSRAVTCADLQSGMDATLGITLVNGAHHIATLVRRNVDQEVRMTLALRYSDRRRPSGGDAAMLVRRDWFIPVAARSTPVTRCAFQMVGNGASIEGVVSAKSDDILMEVVTDGAMTPLEALQQAVAAHPTLPLCENG